MYWVRHSQIAFDIVCSTFSYRSVNLDRQYKDANQIPKAEPWVNLAHDKTSMQHSIKSTKKVLREADDGSGVKPIFERELKRLGGKLRYVQKQQTRQCHLVDHVIKQMAGGEAFLEGFLRYFLTKGPSSTKYCELLPELKGIDNKKLLKKAHDVQEYPPKWVPNPNFVFVL